MPTTIHDLIDHPRLRQALRCPLCHNRKERDLLVCWSCFRRHDFRNGIAPAIARVLDDTEQAHTATPLVDVLSPRTIATLAAIEKGGPQ